MTGDVYGYGFLTLNPTSFYNIEKHVNCTLILKVNHACYAHIANCGLIAYQSIQVCFTHKMKTHEVSFLLIEKVFFVIYTKKIPLLTKQ